MCKKLRKNQKIKKLNKLSEGVLPSEEQLAKSKKYERVVIFGVDGAGDYFDKCDTPNFHRIFEKGSISFTALSQFPTISAQNWTSVLHGVRYQTHRITNGIAASMNYVDKKYPSVFRVLSERHPDWEFASVVNWYPINKGIVENGLSGVYKINAGAIYDGPDDTFAVDRVVCDQVIQFIDKKNPRVLFTHFDGPDHAGHAKGYGSDYYREGVQRSDEIIGKIYDAYEKKGWLDTTLFILVTDHGHVIGKKGGHGGWTPTERFITIAVAGKEDIIAGTMGQASTPDIAAICMYALGEKQPESWECRVPYNIFKTLL